MAKDIKLYKVYLDHFIKRENLRYIDPKVETSNLESEENKDHRFDDINKDWFKW